MKITFVLFVILLVIQHIQAVSVEVSGDMESEFADRVTLFDSSLGSLSQRLDGLNVCNFKIKTCASVSNSVCIRIGRDGMRSAPDGLLSMSETLFELAVEPDGYYLKKGGFKECYKYSFSDVGVTRDRTLSCRIRVEPGDPLTVKSVNFSADNDLIEFDGLQLDPVPPEFIPVYWSDVRVIVRNGGVQSVKISHQKDGSILVIR